MAHFDDETPMATTLDTTFHSVMGNVDTLGRVSAKEAAAIRQTDSIHASLLKLVRHYVDGPGGGGTGGRKPYADHAEVEQQVEQVFSFCKRILGR
jgi:hypothetical protein